MKASMLNLYLCLFWDAVVGRCYLQDVFQLANYEPEINSKLKYCNTTTNSD